MIMITLDNYEEYMMMHADGELQPQEEQALQAFLNDNPKLKAEMALYETVRFAPDHSLVYEQKESLMKPLAAKKIIPMPAMRKYAIAAGVAAIIIFTGVALYNNGSSNTTNNTGVAEVDNTQINNTSSTAQQTTTNNNPETVKVPTQPATVKQPTHTVDNDNSSTGLSKVGTKKKNNNEEHLATATPNRYMAISSQKVSRLNELPTATQQQPLQMVAVTEPAITETITEERRTWFDKLPLDEHKKRSLSNAALAIADGCEQISELKENIGKRSREVSVKVKHKNLIVSF